jgi:hypothetical protein
LALEGSDCSVTECEFLREFRRLRFRSSFLHGGFGVSQVSFTLRMPTG